MMKKISYFLLALFLCLPLVEIEAQSFLEEALKEPIQQAIGENAALKIQRKKGEMAVVDKEVIKAKKLPQVSVMGGYGLLYARLNNEFPTHYLPITGTPLFEDPFVSSFQTQALVGGVSARQVIFTGLQISHGIKALEEKQRAEEFLLEAGKEEVVKEVITTIDQLMLLNEVDKLIEDSEKRLKKEHQKVIKGIENGLAIPYDRDKLQLALLELEEKKVELEGNREVLYEKSQYLTGMECSQLELIKYELIPFIIEESEKTPNNRLELKALEAGRKAKEYVYKKEKGTHWPTVFAFGNLSYVNAFDSKLKLRKSPVAENLSVRANHLRLEPMAAVGLGMKWDIFKGGENRKKIKKAEIDLEISETKLKDTQDKLSLLVKKNQADFTTSQKRIAVAEQQLRVAKNNLQLASRQYNLGLMDLTERLAAENDFYKVSLNYYNQILNQRMAAVELLSSTGELWNKIKE